MPASLALLISCICVPAALDWHLKVIVDTFSFKPLFDAGLRIKWPGICARLVLAGLIFSTFSTAAQSNNAAYTWTTFAGQASVGSVDGVGNNARFSGPRGITVDTHDNLYVVDSANDTIREITAAGVVSTIAGYPGAIGTNDGMSGSARFFDPFGITIDSAGNLYVGDTGNDTIRKLTAVGTNWVVSTIAGLAGSVGSGDGTGTNAEFDSPAGIVVDGSGNLYVADFGNDTIRKLTSVGTNWSVSTIAGLAGNFSNNDGSGTNASFEGPAGITVDASNNLYVADFYDNTIREIMQVKSNWVVSTLAVIGGDEGPECITVDNSGNLYVGGGFFDETINKITRVGLIWSVSALAGSDGCFSCYADGTGTNAMFQSPSGITADASGNLFVADTDNNVIRSVTSSGVVSTLAGTDANAGSANGTGTAAAFNGPRAVAVDKTGNIYVADTGNRTVRKITPAGVVSTIAGQAGVSGTNDGVGSYAQFGALHGVAVDGAGNVYVTDEFNDANGSTIRKISPGDVVTTYLTGFDVPSGIAVDASNNFFVSDIFSEIIYVESPTSPAYITGQIYDPVSIAVDGSDNLYVADPNGDVIQEISLVNSVWVATTIAGQAGMAGSNDGMGTNALFNEPNGVAVDNSGNLYVADTGNNEIRELTFAGGNWVVSTIGGMAGSAGSSDGAGNAARFDSPLDVTVDGSGNVYVADTRNNTIRKGVFTAYAGANAAAYTAPVMTGSLKVTLLPAQASGQWRLPWEQTWHNSGDVVSNLAQDNYTLEFQSVPGYLVIQTNFTVAVVNGATTSITNQYYPTLDDGSTNSIGSLTVEIGPNLVAGTGWRFLGESNWRAPGSTASNLQPDIYFIEFEPVTNYSKPSSQAVQVYAGLPTIISANYVLASSAPGGVLLPFPVPANEISDIADYPFGFNGQLQSDVGYGSGVAVQPNVVLTAAHMVFNDQTLGYVNQIFWYFRQETGVSAPEPQSARGWYVLSGYASQRTNDLLGGLGVDQSSPQSRNLDVAALYFLSPVAGGGSGGYLPSDASPNPWLTGNSSKMLVGYPVDGSEFGNSSIVPGEMYQTQPQPYPLALATDPVTDQEVYNANWFLSYPGNSGGPVYVQYNGYYYPAGVYLGTLYNGVTPYASAVRAIDSTVVNLITNAETLGDFGTNHTGGGVITIVANQAINGNNPGYLEFQLGPSAAVTAGAGWKLSGDSAYGSASNYIRAVTSTNVTVLFNPISGWNSPANQAVAVLPNQITSYSVSYTVSNPLMAINGTVGFGIIGTTGTVYRIEESSSLTTGTWTPLSTNTITSSGFNLVLPGPLTNGPAMFYRAVWLP